VGSDGVGKGREGGGVRVVERVRGEGWGWREGLLEIGRMRRGRDYVGVDKKKGGGSGTDMWDDRVYEGGLADWCGRLPLRFCRRAGVRSCCLRTCLLPAAPRGILMNGVGSDHATCAWRLWRIRAKDGSLGMYNNA